MSGKEDRKHSHKHAAGNTYHTYPEYLYIGKFASYYISQYSTQYP